MNKENTANKSLDNKVVFSYPRGRCVSDSIKIQNFIVNFYIFLYGRVLGCLFLGWKMHKNKHGCVNFQKMLTCFATVVVIVIVNLVNMLIYYISNVNMLTSFTVFLHGGGIHG